MSKPDPPARRATGGTLSEGGRRGDENDGRDRLRRRPKR